MSADSRMTMDTAIIVTAYGKGLEIPKSALSGGARAWVNSGACMMRSDRMLECLCIVFVVIINVFCRRVNAIFKVRSANI